jgi:hypothetical protein
MPGEQAKLTSSTEPSWRRPRFSLLSLLLLVGLSGCLFGLWRAATAKKPAPVSGIVTYQGQPVGSGVIVFEPLDPAGRKATGSVVNGRYAVKPGLSPGSYGVGIRDSSNMLPARYNLPKSSGLSASIRDARANSLNFDLH